MPKKRFSDEQIAFALRQAEAGTTVGEICRKTEARRRRYVAAKPGLFCANVTPVWRSSLALFASEALSLLPSDTQSMGFG